MTTDGTTPKASNKWRRYALAAGILLALVCKSLPPDYQAVCHSIASLCTGGL